MIIILYSKSWQKNLQGNLNVWVKIQRNTQLSQCQLKKKITKKDKNANDKITKISYRVKFIDIYRFMSTSLSNLVSKLPDRLHNDRCIDCKSCRDYMKTKDEQLIFRCFRCKKNL